MTVMASLGWGSLVLMMMMVITKIIIILERSELVLSLFLADRTAASAEQQAKSGISPTPSVIAASVRISATLEITLGPAQSFPALIISDGDQRGSAYGFSSRLVPAGAATQGGPGSARPGGGRTPGMLLGSSEGAWERASLSGAMSEGCPVGLPARSPPGMAPA